MSWRLQRRQIIFKSCCSSTVATLHYKWSDRPESRWKLNQSHHRASLSNWDLSLYLNRLSSQLAAIDVELDTSYWLIEWARSANSDSEHESVFGIHPPERGRSEKRGLAWHLVGHYWRVHSLPESQSVINFVRGLWRTSFLRARLEQRRLCSVRTSFEKSCYLGLSCRVTAACCLILFSQFSNFASPVAAP